MGCIIQEVKPDFKIEANEFDGKIVYGAKKQAGTGVNYETHVEQLSKVVSQLAELESKAQSNFIRLYSLNKKV